MLPWHHVAKVNPTHTHTCEHQKHSTNNQHNTKHSHDSCILCINLHIPNAICDFNSLVLEIASITLTLAECIDKSLIHYPIYLFNLSNKDPPECQFFN